MPVVSGGYIVQFVQIELHHSGTGQEFLKELSCSGNQRFPGIDQHATPKDKYHLSIEQSPFKVLR
jgi:hypothetical protein